MKLIQSLPLVFALLSTAALADIQFTAPPAGAILDSRHVLTAHWKDSGRDPKISELTTYDLYLCAGGDDTQASQEEIALLVKDGAFARGNSVSFMIDPGVGGEDANAYFFKMVSTGPEAAIINFSHRFSLSGMTGSFSEPVAHAVASITNSDGPSAFHMHEQDVEDKQDVLQKRQNVGAYTIPYPLQSDMLTKYAPMAKKPGTAITAQSATRRFPTSAYTVATTYLPIPTVVTTVSASETYSVVSIENTAAAASQPTPNPQMKRWLERWQD